MIAIEIDFIWSSTFGSDATFDPRGVTADPFRLKLGIGLNLQFVVDRLASLKTFAIPPAIRDQFSRGRLPAAPTANRGLASAPARGATAEFACKPLVPLFQDGL